MSTTFSKQTVLDFLRSNPIMSIAVVYEQKPISSVVLSAIDDDFTLYFATHEDTYKSKALMTNPQLSISVWELEKMMIQAQGTATKITDQNKLDGVFDRLSDATQKLDKFWPPVLQIKNSKPYTIFSVKLNWLRVLDLSDQNIGGDENKQVEISLD